MPRENRQKHSDPMGGSGQGLTMRGGAAARLQEPAPAGPDLDAWLGRALASVERVLAKISGNPAAAEAVRELADLDLTLLEVRTAYNVSTVQASMADELVALGRQLERAAQSSRPAPAPRSRKTSQPPLMLVQP